MCSGIILAICLYIIYIGHIIFVLPVMTVKLSNGGKDSTLPPPVYRIISSPLCIINNYIIIDNNIIVFLCERTTIIAGRVKNNV